MQNLTNEDKLELIRAITDGIRTINAAVVKLGVQPVEGESAEETQKQEADALARERRNRRAAATPDDPQTIDLQNPEKLDTSKVLQNRNRSGTGSILQMKNIAHNPDYDRLGVTKDFGSGAPIVAYGDVPAAQKGKITTAIMSDGARYTVQYAVVEASEVLTSNTINGSTNQAYYSDDASRIRAIAGNGRMTGLAQAYKDGTAETYLDKMVADAQAHGVNPEVIDRMKAPVLVRLMQPKDVTADIGDRSNRQGGLQMSAVEEANNDKERVDLSLVKTYEDGSLTRETIQDFVSKMPPEERGSLIDVNGEPTRRAEERASAAIFAKAYENDGLTRLYAQALEPEAKNIIAGLSGAAAAMSSLNGLPNGYDVRDLVADAAMRAVRAIREGNRLDETAAQEDMFGDADANEAAREILKMFADFRRSSGAIKDTLQRMAKELRDAGEEAMSAGGMFGPEELPPLETRTDIVKRTIDKAKAARAAETARKKGGSSDGSAQGSLLDGVKMDSVRMNLWASEAGGAAMRWLLYGKGEKPTAFFDSLRDPDPTFD